MEALLLILTLVLLSEYFLRPRLDYVVDTINNECWIVLWYGRGSNRQYTKLFKYTPPN